MGIGGISPWSLLLILLIVLLLFGTKRLRNMGGDLGDAIKNFKSSVGSSDDKDKNDIKENQVQAQNTTATTSTSTATGQISQQETQGRVIDSEAKHKETSKS